MQKEVIKQHYNNSAPERDYWRNKNKYYYDRIIRHYKFQIPEESTILELGCGTGDLLAALKPSRAVGVDFSEEMIKIAKEKYPEFEFYCEDVETFNIVGVFDYIIISGTLGQTEDIQNFLKRIVSFANSDTRVIIDYYNHLWEPILTFAEKLRLKMPEPIHNWLSLEDIENFLNITGYEIIKHDFSLLFPKNILILTPFLNKFLSKFTIIRRFCLLQFVVARPLVSPDNYKNLTSSVVITCRDEKENIEPLVERIPQLGKNTEIIFVEGHSKDRTREEIQRIIEKYPQKTIRLLVQDGIGQKDAYRKGFDQAKGDFILWLEADLTTPPEELSKFWDAYITGRCEFANGTRLVYKMAKGVMPLLNFLGNRFFGNLITWLLERRFTDTLCGLKAISRRNYLRIRKQLDFFGDFDPFGDFELIFGAVKNNLKVVDIPVKYNPRKYGQTKTKPLKHGCLLLKASWAAFKKFKLF